MNFGVYARKSYYSDTSESTKMQFDSCREYISRTFDKVTTITAYEDDGFVRSDINRPAMNKLRQDISDGLIDCVVIYRIDRICSNMLDFCNFYTFLKERQIKFITVKDGIDTTTPIGEAMMYLAVIFSGIEIQNDTLRITDNMIHLAGKGYWCGGQPPLGYKIEQVYSGKKSHKMLIPDKDGIEYKNRLIDILLSNRFSLQSMETYCRQNGIKTPTGGFLSTTQLHQIFTSPICVENSKAMYDYFSDMGCIMDDDSPRKKWDGTHGIMVYGRTTEKKINDKKRHVKNTPDLWRVSIGVHEPIMSSELYFNILNLFSSNKFDKKSKHETTLLKGVLRCKCGRLMTLARKTKADGTISTWYHCPRRERVGKDACDSKAIKAELLDNKVIDIFKEIKLNPDSIAKYMDDASNTKPTEIPIVRKQISDNQAKIERLTSTLADIGDSTAVKYVVSQIEKLDIEQAELKRKLSSLSAKERQYQEHIKNLNVKREEMYRLLSNFNNFSMSEKNSIARSVIQSAVWDGETLFLHF